MLSPGLGQSIESGEVRPVYGDGTPRDSRTFCSNTPARGANRSFFELQDIKAEKSFDRPKSYCVCGPSTRAWNSRSSINWVCHISTITSRGSSGSAGLLITINVVTGPFRDMPDDYFPGEVAAFVFSDRSRTVNSDVR